MESGSTEKHVKFQICLTEPQGKFKKMIAQINPNYIKNAPDESITSLY